MNKHYTEEQIQLARHYAAQRELACAAACMENGYFADHVTQSEAAAYQKRQIQAAQDIIAGLCDHNLTIRQRMEFYLTGKNTPLLARN